jgi:hypothetical protein
MSEKPVCKVCGKSENLSTCAVCHSVLYCSRECQRVDWPAHKLTHPKEVKLTPPREVKVVLLAENHSDLECIGKNITKVASIISPKPGEYMHRSKFLLVSEGRGYNQCYSTLGLPLDRTIIEHGPEQSLGEMLNKLLLLQQLVFAINMGIIKLGEKKGMFTINKDFFIDRAMNDGFKELLISIDGIKLYEQMIDDAIAKKDISPIFKEILSRILGKLGAGYERENAILTDMLAKNTFTEYKNFSPLLDYYRETRDINIMRRVEERVRAEPSIEVVIIIFGQMHFGHLKSLIDRSDILKFDSKNSLTFGGYYQKYLKYKQKYIALKAQSNFV